MASADQIKALLNSYIEQNDDQFTSVAYQLAAREARKGHGKLAQEIKEIIESAQKKQKLGNKNRSTDPKPNTHVDDSIELIDLLSFSSPNIKLNDMTLCQETKAKLEKIINEQKQIQKLLSHGLIPNQKFLLIGHPGTGKTMSAHVLASELNLPLYSVRLDGLISKYMGETITKLKLIFDSIQVNRAVYLFDEFDSIGTQRIAGNDVGEIKRVLNLFLMLIEEIKSSSIIVAATNHPQVLDKALFRRFDDIINFSLPKPNEISSLIFSKIGTYMSKSTSIDSLAEMACGLSQSEVTKACNDAVKSMVLNDRKSISKKEILLAIQDRKGRTNSDK